MGNDDPRHTGKEATRTTDDDAPLVEDTFLLGGQPYVYTEQDWRYHTRTANDAYEETRAAYFIYLFALAGRHALVENGVTLTREQMTHRVVEFAGGMARLRPFITIKAFFNLTAHVFALTVVGDLL